MRDGWVSTTVGEIAEVVGGSTPSTRVGEHWGGSIPWITPSEVTRQEGLLITATDRMLTQAGLGSIGGHLLPVNTVLLTSRATVGAVAMAGVPMAVNQGFAALVARPGVDPRWLMRWCQFHRPDFIALAGGSTYPEVSKPKVRGVPMDLPPLTEQRRIVDLVGAVDDTARALAQQSGRLTAARRAVATDMLNHEDIARVALKHVATRGGLVGGPFGSSLGLRDYTPDGVPVIRGTNLSTGTRYIGGEFVYVSPAKAKSLRHNLAQPGDIIATQRGTLGQVGIVPSQPHHSYLVSQSQMRLRVDPSRAFPDFVYVALSTDTVRDEIESRKIATANPHINLGIFGALEIPLPDVDTQTRVADAVLAIEDAEAAVVREEHALRLLRSALLDDLISGSHEIPEAYDRFLDGAA